MNITDEELGQEACRRLNVAGLTRTNLGVQTWQRVTELLVTAMREPPWVPEPPVESCMSGWSDAPVEHPTLRSKLCSDAIYILELDEDEDYEPTGVHLTDEQRLSALERVWQDLKPQLATMMMEPPKPPVDEATLCREAFEPSPKQRLWKDWEVETLIGEVIDHTLNWAKNREKN